MSLQDDLIAYSAIYSPTQIVLRDYLLYLIKNAIATGNTDITAIKTAVEALATAYADGFNTGGFQSQCENTLSYTNGSYTIGDTIGTVNECTAAMRGQNKSGVFLSCILIDRTNQQGDLTIVYFNEEPTEGTYTDKSAMVIGDDAPKVCHVQQITASNYTIVGDVSFAVITGISKAMESKDPAGKIYFVIQADSGTDYGSTPELLMLNNEFLQNA